MTSSKPKVLHFLDGRDRIVCEQKGSGVHMRRRVTCVRCRRVLDTWETEFYGSPTFRASKVAVAGVSELYALDAPSAHGTLRQLQRMSLPSALAWYNSAEKAIASGSEIRDVLLIRYAGQIITDQRHTLFYCQERAAHVCLCPALRAVVVGLRFGKSVRSAR